MFGICKKTTPDVLFPECIQKECLDCSDNNLYCKKC